MELDPKTLSTLARDIGIWGRQLGFQQVGISDAALDSAALRLNEWLNLGYHGEMDYMARHGSRRSRPAELVPGTRRVISTRMDYLPDTGEDLLALTSDPARAFVSRYALGRDYHKLIRRRLQTLAERIRSRVGDFGYRAFVDSAPVLEKPLAVEAGLGWIGKHTNLINKQAGSWFFLGELYTDLPLPTDGRSGDHCGSCSACIDICPTRAIVAPYVLDARRCVSYLTIELRGSIPTELRPLIGNRIFGCDDCQAVCPWNRFASATAEGDFAPRNGLDRITLVELFGWDETEFLKRTEGSAIRRIGHPCWLRNIAVALGNSPGGPAVVAALQKRRAHPSELVREHVAWALDALGDI
ncbi:MAG: tRNA epoxyqueuosine(34) reductase QueG [Pseudomonadota bacterium]